MAGVTGFSLPPLVGITSWTKNIALETALFQSKAISFQVKVMEHQNQLGSEQVLGCYTACPQQLLTVLTASAANPNAPGLPLTASSVAV